MKILFSIIVLFTLGIKLQAQNLHLNLTAGAMNYTGDLQDKAYTFSQSHFAGGVGVSYDITDHLSLRAGVLLGKVSANDKYGRNAARNLNFSSNITEFNVGAQYYITPLADHFITPYVFAGLAVYHFNPYTFDTTGKKYYLKPLSTEGEGFVSGRSNYNLTQLAVPFGAGVKFSLSENVNVGVEFGLRKLFTDYLDDVSTTYADPALLQTNRGAVAQELAYRGNEIKNGNAEPVVGAKRGSASYKDWYYFTGVTASFALFTGNGVGAGSGGRHSKYGCPANVQ